MKRPLLILALLSIPVFIWLFWQYSETPETLSSTLESFDKAGEETKKDLSHIPSLPVTEDENSFTMQDDDQTGISITYADRTEENQLTSEEDKKDSLSLSFPKDHAKPIEIRLDKERIITIQDVKNQQGFTFKTVSDDPVSKREGEGGNEDIWYRKFFKKTNQEEIQPTYLTATDQRKTLLYTFQKDHATNEKKLKSWTLYEKGNGIEEEAYQFTDAKIKINDNGDAEVFYFGEKEIQNQQAQADVEPSLLERAQRVISEDMGEDILNSNKNPDFLIPKPFFYDKNGDIHETDWKYDEETKTLSLQISTKDDLYPIALDPTLAFTAPGQSNTGWVVTGESSSSSFGYAMTAGDFNADGKTDLAVGAYGYSTNTGRVYIFHNDGSIPTTAATADVIITGEASSFFGVSLTPGDFNADGKTDLAVGATNSPRAYLFYNDGSIPTTAATADVIITGETFDSFGVSLTSGDFNADGKTDLAVGANGYSTITGRAYIFYNDGSIPTTAATADVIITGETTNNQFGVSLASGDFNADGKTDLVAGALQYSSNTGRAYIFYNGSIVTENASGADVIISGEGYFGSDLEAGDLNSDGKTDLVVGAYFYAFATGRAYIFHNDGSIPTTAATADVIINGTSDSDFGDSNTLSIGDFNNDGRIDLAVGGHKLHGDTVGYAYIFYNDGSMPATAATADVIISGEKTSNYFGRSLVAGDFNGDGKTDLAVGAQAYASSRGRVYIFTSQNGQVNTNVNLTGETTSNNFGYAMASGDFNADGRIDLVVGSYGYSSNVGRAYLFYNDGSIPTTAATADVVITATNYDSFGRSLAAGDLNADGKTDIIAGADGYSGGTGTGRAYIFYADGTNNFGTAACTGSAPTACSVANADVIITGESGSQFGNPLASGDFNADGTTDLVVGAFVYSTSIGRAYIFYNDGSIPTTAATADVIITGEASSNFGISLASGDFNADGETDLAVGAYTYSTSTGRAYIFYNDGSIPTTAATADVIITGETTNNYFGISLASGDFNADGETDLAIGAHGYSSSTGRAYIFYNDGSIPTTAATADVIITGETTSNYFGYSLISGDLNADGKTDLVVGAYGYSTTTGRVYLLYNDGSVPTTAATADVMITGETTSNRFGLSLATGDLNADGKTDLVVGAYYYSTQTGRVYLYETRDNFAWQLQAQSSLSGGLRTNPSFSGQELKITGEVGTGQFGNAMVAGDFNADGKTDLAVGASAYSSSTGRVYIFYSDGHLAAAATNADVVITGEASSSFGASFAVGDFNSDSKIDLAVGAWDYASGSGRAYIFYNDGAYPSIAVSAEILITGSGTTFGWALSSGDFNADGKTDLVSGTPYYLGNDGRVYIFYNDGSIPTTAVTADVIITGSGGARFGTVVVSGDYNADGKTDIIVSSPYAPRYRIFYNDGSYPTTEGTCDISIDGNDWTGTGIRIVNGDFNADGRTDFAISEPTASANAGRIYIVYNDGTYPATLSSADVIIYGASGGDYFGFSLASGDFNSDGRTDLVGGAYGYPSAAYTGRVYIFYNDGSIPTTAATADVTITGEEGAFGGTLASGDFNADGKADLAVGATGYSSNRGRAYMYTFNDGVVTGETTSNYFGYSLASGDFNADGKTDLAVGAYRYSSYTGRIYIFYNDGSIPTAATGSDVIITGEGVNNYFGISLAAGDLNADGRADLVVNTTVGTAKLYIFYNDGSIPTTAATADVIISGSSIGDSGVAIGDLNSDGRPDLLVTAFSYSTNGRAYLFYADGTNNFGTAACTGSAPTACSASNADIIVDGTGGKRIGVAAIGDVNADGRDDMLLGGTNNTAGAVYILYNDGVSFGTAACTTACSVTNADVSIAGENNGDSFGSSISASDFNVDSRIDLVVGAPSYSTQTGRTYLFYNDGTSLGTTVCTTGCLAANADVIITGEGVNNYFGISLAAGDLNADGKTDLAVGADHALSGAGRAYLFYNDGSYPSTAVSADIIIAGESNSVYFSTSLAPGDFNADGKTDLAVGSYNYSSGTGRAYIFTTEARVVGENVEGTSGRGNVKFRGNVNVR